MKKIVIASLRQERNSFTPVRTSRRDFTVFKGDEVNDITGHLDVFRKEGFDLLPAIWAYALPGGIVGEESYISLRNELLESIPDDGSISGVWLYLHGAMEVENIGSGEADLVSEIRKKVGESVPIAAAFDFHANISNKLIQQINIVCGYRTAPHIDMEETQIKAFRLLAECIEKKLLPKPVMKRIPFLFPGEMAVTGIEPLKSLMNELENTEKGKGFLSVSFFCGMAWIDSPDSMACIVAVDARDQKKSVREAGRLAGLFFAERKRFGFEEETAEPDEAVRRALKTDRGPVFITDSGDNVTAGAPGDSIHILRILLKSDIPKRALIAGILDGRAVTACDDVPEGLTVEVELGGTIDKEMKPEKIKGRIIWKGHISGKTSADDIKAVTLRAGNIDIIVTAERCAFTSTGTLEAVGVNIAEYHMIIVKQGYLFDSLRKASGRTIMALTPGSASPDVRKFTYRRLTRPVYPLDESAEINMKMNI